jgi:hypothetical protein
MTAEVEARAVSRWLHTVPGLVPAQVMWSFDGENGTVAGFLPVSPANSYSTNCSRFINNITHYVEVEVEVTLRLTVSQSVSTCWYRVPLCDLRPDITSCRNVAV